jgi:hypothetical protein
LILAKPSVTAQRNLPATSGRRWALAIVISILFHLAMAWSFFEAGIHWPLARSEPIDTRVAPPIDAVTVDLSDPTTQAAEPPGRAPAPVTVTPSATPRSHLMATGSISITNTGFSVVPGVDGNGTRGIPASGAATTEASHAAIRSQQDIAAAAALLGIEAPRNVRKIVYVVDRSASMGPGGALERATAAVADSIGALPGEAQFQVVFYNRRPALLPADQGLGLWKASAQAKAIATQSLSHWRAEGGTDHLSAIRAALGLRPEVIYWLTDGADLTLAEIDSITRSNRWKVMINTIGMGPGNGTGAEPLQRVALANGGTFRQLSSNGD